MPIALTPGDGHVDPNGVVARFIRTTAGTARYRVGSRAIESDPLDRPLTEGVGRHFETMFALAARAGVDRVGRMRDPLQHMLAIWENLVPGSSRPRGCKPWIEAERRGGAPSPTSDGLH
jgi:hypothetical protein